ncbi:MAG: hypothetical protein KY475_03585 [Planctomycetes bacterium]|nr:hypothetical protein [Planctomycetota bacterium]
MPDPEQLAALLDGRLSRVAAHPRGEVAPPRVLFPGSFNPLHAGHREMAHVAGNKLNQPVAFEVSILNVDKPDLDEAEIRIRLAQFTQGDFVWLTRAPTFLEKSALFPGATFVVGADTLRRIGDVRYYGDDPRRRDDTIELIKERGCRFFVFGRACNETGDFLTLDDCRAPASLRDICDTVSPAEFRCDISSTQLRRTGDQESG